MLLTTGVQVLQCHIQQVVIFGKKTFIFSVIKYIRISLFYTNKKQFYRYYLLTHWIWICSSLHISTPHIYIYTSLFTDVKSNLADKMKRSFFQAAVVSILLYGCTTWTLTKRLEKKLDGNYTRMLRAILNKSWRQYPTKH